MAGYVFNGVAWRPINGIYVFNGTAWRPVTTGWQFDGTNWKNIYTSGTFLPEIRNQAGDPIYNWNVGVTLNGYRGSNVAGTYVYQWQYDYGSDYGSNWRNSTGTNNSGTLTGTTLTTAYTTTTADVTILEAPVNAYTYYIKFVVTKSGETQESQTTRIHKRQPYSSAQTWLGARNYNPASTYDATVRNPYVGDTLTFWSSVDWTSTTNITNDTRPDWYIFTYTTAAGVTTKDSRILDTSPRTPTNASKYVPVTADLNSPVVVEVQAFSSNPNRTIAAVITTRNVDDGVLKAPTGLVLDRAGSLYPGKIVMRWNPSDGGNDNTITYTWYLYRDGINIVQGTTTSSTQPVSVIYPSTGSVNTAGDYKFYVDAAQLGSTTVASGFSDTLTLTPPTAFTYNAANVTATQGGPGDFTINAFAESATSTNQWDLSWSTSASPSASRYETTWYDPVGGNTFTDTGASRTDYNFVYYDGNHTLQVDAYQKAVQTIKLMWTKPAGTSAASYRISYQIVNSSGIVQPFSVIVEDVTEYTYQVAATALSTRFLGITAYDGPGAEGVSRAGTQQGTSFFNNAALQVEGKTTKTRVESLSVVIPSIGDIEITGNAEPNESLTWRRIGSWSPASNALGWTISRRWGITRYATSNTDIYNRGTGSTMTPTTSDIGEYALLEITATYKDEPSEVLFAVSDTIVPGPPTYTVTDNYNGTFTISSVSSAGAGSYIGDYTGGTIPATTLTTSYTSPTLTYATKTINLYGRARKAIFGTTETFIGRRATSTDVTLKELGAFTWSASNTTASPDSAPGTITVTMSDSRVDLNWDDVTNADSYFSYINGGTGYTTARSNYRTVSNDFWAISNGGNSYSGYVTSVNRSGTVNVTWGASNNAAAYRVNYTIGGVAANSGLLDSSTTSYNISSISLTSTAVSVAVTSVISYAFSTGGTPSKTGTASGTTTFSMTEKQSGQTSWTGTSLTYPGTPGTPTVTRSGSTFTVSWTAATNASNYNFYVSQSTSVPATAEATGDSSPSDYTASGTGTYYFWVQGVNANGVGAVSGRGQGTIPVPIPAVPTGASISYTSFSGGNYNWSSSWDATANATSYTYQFQFATSISPTVSGTNTVTTAGVTGTSGSGSSPKFNARFRVLATNASGSSNYSSYTGWA